MEIQPVFKTNPDPQTKYPFPNKEIEKKVEGFRELLEKEINKLNK